MLKKIFFSCVLIYLVLISSQFALAGEITAIKWTSNVLEIDSNDKILYQETRLKEPDRLVLDLVNTSLSSNISPTRYVSRLGENISVYEFEKGKVRIIVTGESSINRKVYPLNDQKSLILKIARIDTSSDLEVDKPLPETAPEVPEIKIGNLESLSIEEDGGDSFVSISASEKIIYNTYILKNPSRLVIDLINILPPDKQLPKYNSTKLVTGLRIGRAASGIDATRIVVDLNTEGFESKVAASLGGDKLKIKLKSVSDATKTNSKISSIKIIIDPGHGGYDHGAEYGGYREKDINLIISKKLKTELEKYGIKAFLTRTDDTFISLAERVEITNSVRPDVFISIHANALTSFGIRGVETYYWTPQSQKLAFLIHKSILKNIKIPDHNIRKSKFYVIKHTYVPAILAELAFLSNAEDRKLLTSPLIQDDYAKALSDAILKFLDVEPEVIKNEKPSTSPSPASHPVPLKGNQV